MCTTDGGDGQARAQGFALNRTGSLTNFQQVVLAYLKKCGIKHTVIHGGKRQLVWEMIKHLEGGIGGISTPRQLG